MLLAAALVAAVVAVGQRNQAVAAQRTVIARAMVAQADQIRDRDPRGALQFSVAAHDIDPSPLTQASLMQTLTSRYHSTLTGHTNTVTNMVFSPDGHTLATTSLDQTIILWDLTDHTHPRPLGRPLAHRTKSADEIAFSPDGRTLATTNDDTDGVTVILWDLTDRTHPTASANPSPATSARWRFPLTDALWSPPATRRSSCGI